MAAALCLGLAAAAPEQIHWVTLNNGVRMPQMALGTFQYDNATAEDAIVKGYAAGFRNFMTAYSYYNQGCGKGNCSGVARALQTLAAQGVKRSDYFLSSMTPPCRVPAPLTGPKCYNYTRDRIDDDISLMGVEYLDMVIIHFPETGPARGCDDFACETGMGDWRAYEDALASGKVRSIGVSNYCQKCLDCVLANSTVKPQLNQFQFHLGMGPDPTGLVSYTTDHGVLVQSYTTLASGKILNPDTYANASDIAAIGAAHNVTAAQVALKWVLQRGHAVATKADKVEYLEQDMDVYSWNLTDAELASLDALPCNRTGWPMGYCDPSFVCPAHTFAPAPARK